MNTNALQQWLDFYDKNMPASGGAGMYSSGGTFYSPQAAASMRAASAHNSAGGRLGFALQMADKEAQQTPNFFGDEGGAGMDGGGMGGGMPAAKFVKPERFNQQMPERQSFVNPMRGDIENYLARFLRGR